MNSVNSAISITARGNWVLIKLPKELISRAVLKSLVSKAGLDLETALLSEFEKGRQDFEADKLKPIDSLSELI